MERIDPSQHFYHLPPSLRKDENRSKKTSEGKGLFSKTLEKQEVVDQARQAGVDLDGPAVDEDALAELLDEIHHWGAQLSENPNAHHIQEYRKRVSTFLRSLIRNSLKLEETEGRLRKDLKRPKYTVIKVVNQKLDQLAAAVLLNQKDKFALLAKTNELHGLLVDLIS